MDDTFNIDYCLTKERVQFGKYRFVKIDPHPRIPIFRCCPSHDGDVNVPQQGRNNINHQQPPLPTNFNCSFVNSNTSHANALPKPLPPPQITNDDSFYDDDDDDDMDVDILSSNGKYASAALFGFPEVPEQLSRLETSDIQILDVLPSTAKPTAAAAAKYPTVGTINDDDDDFDNDEEFLAAVDA
uniref:Uncharacterized protein n=1 Tax=Panagrolaimus sp. PS1159 TaxID=55785 RepID=A0AC35GAT5_9BILA